MKEIERQKAVKLRQKGLAVGVIAKKLGVAKSSVSIWVRGVVLSKAFQEKLKQNSHSRRSIEKRRTARLLHTDIRRAAIKERALTDIEYFKSNPLWYIGVSLYWGEGGKTQQVVRVSNSDPAVIGTMMNFFRLICGVQEKNFRGQLHIFDHSDVENAERYWSHLTGIPTTQFYKTYTKNSRTSKHKRDTLPYGTFQVYVNDSVLFFRILAWIEYLKKHTYD